MYTLYIELINKLYLRNTSRCRHLNDRTRYGVCPVVIVDTLLFENFESTSGSGVIALANWTNFASAGTKNWTSTGTTNKNARFSAFSSNVAFQQPSNVGWLITPALNLDLTTNEKLVYRQTVRICNWNYKDGNTLFYRLLWQWRSNNWNMEFIIR
jgi:hypothetical protein